MNLSGMHVVVTGANGALGSVVASTAAGLGARVSALDLAFSDDTSLAAERHSLDLLDAGATRELFAGLDAVDAVFNIAGGFAMGSPAYADDDDWERMFAINVTTLRNVVRAVVPGMLERGSGKLVNVGAAGAAQGQAGMNAYIAAKSTVMRLTESLAADLRHQGINVNAVLPTVIDTPANRDAMPDADPSEWVAPQDLANVICFLGSEAARAVHGALVPVRGLS
jgi:NAD(P)-dependent dehydrogenase (short-subunit alcohol dehydrogenase family)